MKTNLCKMDLSLSHCMENWKTRNVRDICSKTKRVILAILQQIEHLFRERRNILQDKKKVFLDLIECVSTTIFGVFKSQNISINHLFIVKIFSSKFKFDCLGWGLPDYLSFLKLPRN